MVGGAIASELFALVVASHLAAAATAALLAGYVLRYHRDRDLARVFALLLGALTVWTVGSGSKLLTQDPGRYVGLSLVQYVGITLSAAFLFLFALHYDERERWLSPRVIAGLLVVPALTLLALATTNAHGLFYADYRVVTLGETTVLQSRVGPLFWGWAAYGWALLVGATALVVSAGLRRSAFYRVQSALVMLGMGLSWLVNLAYLVFQWPHPAVDPTPLGLTGAAVLFTIGVFTTRLPDVLPAARSEVLDAIDDAVIAVDPHGRIADVNASALSLFDDDPPLRESADAVLPQAVHRLDTQGPTTVELTIDGESGVYQYRRLPVGPEGVHGEVIVLTELTELLRARRELERQNERLEEFASVVSHDLRNPLTVAQGNLELARSEVEHESLEAVETAHRRMGQLIDDLLALSRQGRLVGDPEPVDLRAAAEAAWESVETPAATLDLGAELGTVGADRDRLEQLLGNLFANAVEHAGPTVTVRVKPTAGGFVVEDDGPGVDVDDPDRLFEHGYTTSPDGTGFGLAIVHRIAGAHGWTVSLVDGADGGLRVEFGGVDPV